MSRTYKYSTCKVSKKVLYITIIIGGNDAGDLNTFMTCALIAMQIRK